MPWREQLKIYREVYRERRDALLGALTDLMPDGTTWTHPSGGLFVWATLPHGLDAKSMMPRAIAARVAYVPGTGFYADGTGRSNLRLNFSFPPPERIREGVRRLAGVVEQEMAVREVFGTFEKADAANTGRTSGKPPQLPGLRWPQAGADVPGPDLA
jgi:DNA-binding transcriptional MocR family regulator